MLNTLCPWIDPTPDEAMRESESLKAFQTYISPECPPAVIKPASVGWNLAVVRHAGACKTLKAFPGSKVINHKYYKHLAYVLAHKMRFVCSKMINYKLFSLLFMFFCVKIHYKLPLEL